jgi:hypothetical protein
MWQIHHIYPVGYLGKWKPTVRLAMEKSLTWNFEAVAEGVGGLHALSYT